MERRILLLGCTLFLGACDGDETPPANTDDAADGERGEWTPSGKSDEIATCVGACGDLAASGCWCDESCSDFGDCCPDKVAICDFECPQLVPPAPGFCDSGEPSSITDEETGCVTGFECIECPNLTPPSPDFCPDGSVSAVVDEQTSCVTGFECIQCPNLTPPAPGFCPGGTIVSNIDDETGCISGFECVTCPQIVPPAPGFCPDGTIVATFDGDGGCLTGFQCA